MTYVPYSKSFKAVQQLCVMNRLKCKFLFAENSPLSPQTPSLTSNLDIRITLKRVYPKWKEKYRSKYYSFFKNFTLKRALSIFLSYMSFYLSFSLTIWTLLATARCKLRVVRYQNT